ncbi:hypothetical protein [Parvibaculum sp.]|uniref:hypothetical protein n=1 Tax=Parvibaculum sp. TaxID=2024848 RepID=UPI001B0A3A49|nr:hypothetical protein [Parvibaculum sp.]MBO6669732.1 hypothetical protein [Parvibaculum sp.]MBO6693285.1 hypothetical protein [Parvibaculum sp.]MBO6716239.1 hypothetical protein [Parvibaculum sp.]
MSIDLGGISFDEGKLQKQLRYDLKDDWFPDPAGYEDLFRDGLIGKLIEKNFENNHGRYVPADLSP